MTDEGGNRMNSHRQSHCMKAPMSHPGRPPDCAPNENTRSLTLWKYYYRPDARRDPRKKRLLLP